MFNFERLISRYSKFPVFLLREAEGYFNYEAGGVWTPGIVEEISIKGAVVPLSNSDLKYDEGGSYSIGDYKLYTYTDIALGEKVRCKDKEYTVQEKKDYSDFDIGLNIYFIKRVGE